MNLFKLFIPKQAVDADLVYFDLFVPTTSQFRAEVLSVKPIVSGAVAVTGVVGVDLHLTRTSAVGTGGTAATYDGSSTTAATISGMDCTQPLTAKEITARLTPTGGATAAAMLAWLCVFTEETSSGPYLPQEMVTDGGIIVPPGTGLRVVQGAVASVGNIGFDILFGMHQRP